MLLQYKNSTTSKIFIDDDSKLLVGVPNLNTEYFCLDRKIKKIDAMLLYDFNINEYNYILNFCNTYSTETIYLPKSYIEFVDILDFGNIKVEYYNNILKHKNSNIEMVYNNTKELIMIKIDNGLNTIAYLPKNISSADLSYISSEIDAEYFLVICDKEYYNLNDYNIKYNKLVCGASDINTDSIELYKLKEFIVRV